MLKTQDESCSILVSPLQAFSHALTVRVPTADSNVLALAATRRTILEIPMDNVLNTTNYNLEVEKCQTSERLMDIAHDISLC
ncbi:hypothetical protein NPIL_295761 [Nephila pilipes]|uniref:Uncharacterized protein n=1 Tax=Nephila pilipes TaxID=299642 RepID=A0A8X6QYR1_NEPPI|nr:hypothetical protein NPIL_295761 [Nephila pilipes]